MKHLNETLSAYGVNWPEVMERFVNDEALYYDCLRSFLEDPSFPALGDALCTRDCKAVFEYAHTLKGVAGNLGLTPLFVEICRIVELSRNHTNSTKRIEQHYHAVLREKEKLQHLLYD